jgi:hypothetical protein
MAKIWVTMGKPMGDMGNGSMGDMGKFMGIYGLTSIGARADSTSRPVLAPVNCWESVMEELQFSLDRLRDAKGRLYDAYSRAESPKTKEIVRLALVELATAQEMLKLASYNEDEFRRGR